MYDIFISVVTTILSGLLLFVMKDNISMKKNNKRIKESQRFEAHEKEKIRDELLLGVARVLLSDKIQGALLRGETTQAEYEIIEELYKPYIEHGGNGVVKHLFEDRYHKLKVRR
ncbi:MAG: hypothetical protein HFF01_03180 [Erysipelotrichaceae bacterium]|nr:hypothetical protein [Erysipelotrichaceae bacterium]MCI9524035.1 hypothetical protein [Erysipelotrichaceae bacterium]